MLQRLLKNRTLWTILGVAAALTLLLSFSQGREAAARFLAIFREPRPASASTSSPNTMSNLQEQGIARLLSNDVQIEMIGLPRENLTPQQAEELAGFAIRLPVDGGAAKISLQPGISIQAVIDLPRLQSILDEIGQVSVELPAELNGASVSMKISPSIEAVYGLCGAPEEKPDPDVPTPTPVSFRDYDCTTLVQLPAPEITLPEGLDTASLAKTYLQLLGMNEDNAGRFLEISDWTLLLISSLPTYADVQEANVDGVAGVLLDPGYPGARLAIVWQREGMVYILTTYGDPEKALQTANSLQEISP